MKIKPIIISIVILIICMALSYVIVTSAISLLCGSLLYMMKNPIEALLVTLNIMALGFMFNMLYNKYKF